MKANHEEMTEIGYCVHSTPLESDGDRIGLERLDIDHCEDPNGKLAQFYGMVVDGPLSAVKAHLKKKGYGTAFTVVKVYKHTYIATDSTGHEFLVFCKPSQYRRRKVQLYSSWEEMVAAEDERDSGRD